MPWRKPIVVIENDLEDQELIAEAFEGLRLPFPVKFFADGEIALSFLQQRSITPLVVISDINMPGMNGFQLRDIIMADEELCTRCTPYIFLTDSSSLQTAIGAYKRAVQGLFVKPQTYNELQDLLNTIMKYWQKAVSAPKNYQQ